MARKAAAGISPRDGPHPDLEVFLPPVSRKDGLSQRPPENGLLGRKFMELMTLEAFPESGVQIVIAVELIALN